MENNARQFNIRFFGSLLPKVAEFFDRKVVIPMNKDTNATIELSDPSIVGTYTGYLVRIINKKNGEIDNQFFKFNNHLEARSDNREDYKGGFSIASHCGWDWYIAKPIQTETNNMTRRMLEYIEMWK